MDFENVNINHEFISKISFVVVFLYAINATVSFKNGRLSWNCDSPLLGSYLYLLLGFMAMYFFSTVIVKRGLDNSMTNVFSSFILALVLTFVLFVIPSDYVITKHLVWFIYLFCLSIMLFPSRMVDNSVYKSIILTVGIFLTLTVFANVFPNLVQMSWERTLIFALLVLIIITIINGVFYNNRKLFTYISVISIGVFALFTIIDTRKLGLMDCAKPDYIENTLNLFLDTINIFVNVYSLNSNN
jgi:FtsH-binding integral membrane protein